MNQDECRWISKDECANTHVYIPIYSGMVMERERERERDGNARVLNGGIVPYTAIFWSYIYPLVSPYIGLVYGRYLQLRFLKWPLKREMNMY